MKQFFTIIALTLLAPLSFAQYFTLTPNGFLSEGKNNYTVVDFPNTKQNNIYKNVLHALNTMYKDPKKVLTLVDGESITINGYEEYVIPHRAKSNPIQIGKTNYEFDVSYTISILFKDNKMRINSPTFECRRWMTTDYSAKWVYLTLNKDKKSKASIYGKENEINAQDSYDALDKHFNNLIAEIIKKSKTVNDW